MRHDYLSCISMTTIDGEAFVKGDEVIPEYMIERKLDRFVEALSGARIQCFLLGAL